MAPRVQAPVEGYTGSVAGVAFVNGSGDTDSAAALAYFRRKGYRIESEVSPVGTPIADDEQARADASEAAGDDGGTPKPDKADSDTTEGAPETSPTPQSEGKPERPHPVQDNKAAWFEYLSAIKPDHGFSVDDLEKVTRKALIEAANEVDGTEG